MAINRITGFLLRADGMVASEGRPQLIMSAALRRCSLLRQKEVRLKGCDEQPPARPPPPTTAIFAGVYIVAMGALQALTEAGLSVPDNTTFGPISLTSVDQAGHHIGANAARLLLGRIADQKRPSAQVKLSPPSSSAAPPQPRQHDRTTLRDRLARLTPAQKIKLLSGREAGSRRRP
jgi:hypothetical protein